MPKPTTAAPARPTSQWPPGDDISVAVAVSCFWALDVPEPATMRNAVHASTAYTIARQAETILSTASSSIRPNRVRTCIGRLPTASRAAPLGDRVAVIPMRCAARRLFKRVYADQSTLSVVSPYGPFHQRTHTRDVFRLPKNETMTESTPYRVTLTV